MFGDLPAQLGDAPAGVQRSVFSYVQECTTSAPIPQPHPEQAVAASLRRLATMSWLGRGQAHRVRATHAPSARGCSSAAEHQLPKLRTRVRFPSPAPRRQGVDRTHVGSVKLTEAPPVCGIVGGVDRASVRRIRSRAMDRPRPLPPESPARRIARTPGPAGRPGTPGRRRSPGTAPSGGRRVGPGDRRHLDQHLPARGRVADGVGQQVVQDLADAGWVHPRLGQPRSDRGAKGHVLLSGLRLVPPHHLVHQGAERHRLRLEDQATGLGERQRVEVVDQMTQPAGLVSSDAMWWSSRGWTPSS